MKKLIIAAVLVLGLVSTQTVFAYGHGKRGSSHWGQKDRHSQDQFSKLEKKMKFLYKHKDELKITDDQLKAIKDIKRNAAKQLIQSKADADIFKVDIRSGMMEKSLDVNTLNGLIDKKYEAKKRSAKTFVKAIADVKNVLSDEQKDQMHALMKKSNFSKDGCSKCSRSKGGKICPITGKPLDSKGSAKGSRK